jgi:hypothetical protein
MENKLIVLNDGQLITETNYWQTSFNESGYFYLSINAGAIRLLVPENFDEVFEFHTAEFVVVTFDDSTKKVSILFDDKSDCPYQITLSYPQVDRIPPYNDSGRKLPFIVYVKGAENTPIENLKLTSKIVRS